MLGRRIYISSKRFYMYIDSILYHKMDIFLVLLHEYGRRQRTRDGSHLEQAADRDQSRPVEREPHQSRPVYFGRYNPDNSIITSICISSITRRLGWTDYELNRLMIASRIERSDISLPRTIATVLDAHCPICSRSALDSICEMIPSRVVPTQIVS